jgi:hypothetical protein
MLNAATVRNILDFPEPQRPRARHHVGKIVVGWADPQMDRDAWRSLHRTASKQSDAQRQWHHRPRESHISLPCSTRRNFATISSGIWRFLGISVLLSAK